MPILGSAQTEATTMQAAASINPLLNAIGEHIAAFSASVTLSGSLPTRSHNVRELTALRDDPSVVHSVVQSDADLEHIDQLQTSLAEARLRLQMRRAKLENALSMVGIREHVMCFDVPLRCSERFTRSMYFRQKSYESSSQRPISAPRMVHARF